MRPGLQLYSNYKCPVGCGSHHAMDYPGIIWQSAKPMQNWTNVYKSFLLPGRNISFLLDPSKISLCMSTNIVQCKVSWFSVSSSSVSSYLLYISHLFSFYCSMWILRTSLEMARKLDVKEDWDSKPKFRRIWQQYFIWSLFAKWLPQEHVREWSWFFPECSLTVPKI